MSNHSDDKWYMKPIFTSFWNHYNQCNEWLEQSGHKMVEFSDEIDDNIDCYQKCDITADNNQNCLTVNSVETNRQQSMNRCQQTMDSLESIDENEFINERKPNEELIAFDANEVLDISEDYLEFVMKTKRHQNERKKLREKRLRYNDRVEYVDISRLDSFSRKSVAPKRTAQTTQPILKPNKELSAQDIKKQKMFELYGDDYNLIQGMEAALQLNFDRLCDINQPKFWPIMPIRMPSNRS